MSADDVMCITGGLGGGDSEFPELQADNAISAHAAKKSSRRAK
jgi:hypothetical protein